MNFEINGEPIFQKIERLAERIQAKPLEEVVASLSGSLFLGEGQTGAVVSNRNEALKIGFGFGIEQDLAVPLARICHQPLGKTYSYFLRRFTNSLEELGSFKTQIAAHIIGQRVLPHLIDAPSMSIHYKNKTLGYSLPVYHGQFMSLSDRRFKLTPEEEAILRENKLNTDDFSRSKNGVILPDGSRKIIDLTLKI